MTSPTGAEVVCYPTRIVSGAIHDVDPERSLHTHGKKNEWDVVLSAFRRYLAGQGRPQDNFHFTEAPGMCPLATPVDFTQVRAIAYQCGLPVRGQPARAIDVVRIELGEGSSMFFLAEPEQAQELEEAWAAHRGGADQSEFTWGAAVHTGNLYRMTWMIVAFDRIADVTRTPLP